MNLLKKIQLFAIALVGCMVLAESLSAKSPFKQYSIEQFLKTTSYRGVSFSHDNAKVLVSSDATGIFNVYSIDIAGGETTQLTRSENESNFAIAYFPQDDRFFYTADQGGNELNHVYVKNADGTSTDLTPGDNLKAEFAGISQDDKSFFVIMNQRDPKFFDVYEYQFADLSRKLIYQNDEGYLPGAISPDGNLISLAKIDTRDNSDIYIYDRRDKTTRCVTEHEGDISHAPQDFTPDSKQLVYTTNEGSEFQYLRQIDLETGEVKQVAKFDWDVTGASFSKSGKYFVVNVNEDASTKIYAYEYPAMKEISLPTIDGASLSSLEISSDEKHMAMYATSGKMPNDLFYYDMSNPPKQLTQSLNPEINRDDLVNGEVVRFDSFDGVTIPGILYMPHNASTTTKVPALVWVHGGPGGQSRLGYTASLQYLVNHGYAIYAINNRGSSGYGKKFQQMDDQKHGEGDLDDCVASKTMLIETGKIDPDRIGILGGSYGGYMVCAAMAFRPDAFQVGVDIFGVTNWYRTVQSIPPWWEAYRKLLEKELGDFDDLEYFKKISPLFHAKNIKNPMIVLQGANDARVLQVESDEMVAAVRANGIDVEYIVFPDEGHGFQKKANRLKGYEGILRFCDKYLKSDN